MDTTPHSTDPEASQISSSQVPAVDEIPFRLVAAHERKTTKLLKNAIDHEALKSRNSYFSFAFESPIFLHSVQIDVEEFVDGAKFEYVWEGIDGRMHYGDAVTASDEVSISVRGLAKSIAFKPPRVYFAKPFINAVELIGFEISQAGDFIEFADTIGVIRDSAVLKINKERASLEEERGKVNALQAQRGSLNQDITALKSAVSREQEKLKRVEIQRDEVTVRHAEIVRAISNEEARLGGIKSEISRSSSTRSRLAKSVSDKTAKLRDLQSNIHLFPSELSDF